MLLLALSCPATFCLIALCVAVWSNISAGKWDITALNFTLTACVERNQWYRVFTAPFAHRTVAHLVVNAVALWACLSRIESVYGGWFVLRYTLLLLVGEAVTTLMLVRSAVHVYRRRKDIAQWCRRSGQWVCAGLNCREAWASLRGMSVASVRSTVIGWGHSLQRHLAEPPGFPSAAAPALPDAQAEAGSQYTHPFARVTSHPLSLEPVLGLSGVCLAWLVFTVMQASAGQDLHPLPSASTLPMTQRLIQAVAQAAAEGGGAETAVPSAARMAKVALATTDYSVFGLFGLDPSLAPVLFLLVVRLVAPAGLGAETDDRYGGAMALLAQTQTGVRYTLQSMCGFLLGLGLGLDVLTLLPSVFWTACLVFNCLLLCLNSLASNNAALVRRALNRDDNASEPLLEGSRSVRPSSNILGLDLAPEMFDEPNAELPVPQWFTETVEAHDNDLAENQSESWP